jgi:hypothetical protein
MVGNSLAGDTLVLDHHTAAWGSLHRDIRHSFLDMDVYAGSSEGRNMVDTDSSEMAGMEIAGNSEPAEVIHFAHSKLTFAHYCRWLF